MSTHSFAELHAYMAANLAAHASTLQATHPTMTVRDDPDLLVVDSGLPCDTFNLVCRARLKPAQAQARIAEVVAYFHRVDRPFSWWVSPGDSPPELPALLTAAGLIAAECETAMAMDLDHLPAVMLPSKLAIRQATTPQGLADFGAVIADDGDRLDPWVVAFYQLVVDQVLAAKCPLRFYVGYVAGRPVACSELCLAAGVAGLYSVVTLAGARRRGYGTALTGHALREAKAAGYTTAILQASAEGLGLYTRLGFAPAGQITEFKP
ncbi:MAG: GNAT family N-acetyltransferase [Chloroflexi bacterium]|nr:GNAT family N-acetyltransferase [Chloroflexota bacterium]MCI0575598.1 GNAT family N-acetyltransferase [Chloroflexota bacterium]MCI0645065.1 GNAT family N-acetyltransferase [Chloroflexota bacterium]MCI0731901.1 GNAT family N-acetyltransferase [Chloroflexota bacterium]